MAPVPPVPASAPRAAAGHPVDARQCGYFRRPRTPSAHAALRRPDGRGRIPGHDGHRADQGTGEDGHAAAPARRTDMMVRVGLIGAGAVGTRHARTLAGFDDVELVGICDPERPAAEALAGELQGPARDGPESLLRAGVDAVWLCVPPFAHGELELSVVRAGLPFFVEKPLAGELAVAQRVAEAVAAAGLPTATGYHWRHLDTVERARLAVRGRHVRLLDARWWGTTPPAAWWGRHDLSGGQVVEQATHVLDLARLLA